MFAQFTDLSVIAATVMPGAAPLLRDRFMPC